MTPDVIDLFAGPGGWDEGARMLGLTDLLGVEWEPTACATAEAAGHRRIQADVAALNPADYRGVRGGVFSPPCQAWSQAGSGGGELDRAACHTLVDRMAFGDDSLDWHDWADERSALVAQPVRWVREILPEWIAMEEVPAVLGLWEHVGHIFRGWGYTVWTGILNAADYGVPQTRRRAILIASRVRPVSMPPATHTRIPSETLFGDDLLPWVSMAEALGWADTDVVQPARGAGMTERHGDREPHPASGPAPTVISKSRSWRRIVTNQCSAGSDEYYSRSTDEPAPTLTTNARLWQLRDGGQPVHDWAFERPSTTVAGDPGERQHEHSIRITPPEAALLQSFRPDYPWQGSNTKKFEQIGNAVPPLLARAVLSEAAGIPVRQDIAA